MGNFGIVLGKYWSIVRMLAFISCLDFTTASDSLTFSTPRNNVQPQCICQDPTKAIHNSPLRLSGFRDSITVRDSVMICSEENAFIKKIRFAMNPVEDFAVITVNHDPSILNMSIIVNEDFDKDYVKIFKGERSIETRERSQYAIVKPSSCRQKCLVSILLSSSSKYFSGYNALQVTSKGSKSICPSLDYELSVNLGRMLSVGGRIKSSVVMGKVKRFGVEISEKYHSILVQLTPNQRIRNMDVDLFIYNETNIFDFIFPNSDPHNRNHVRNSPELALISFQHSSSTSGFYLIHVHAPTETSQDINTFQLDILPNSKSNLKGVYISLI